MKIPNGSQNGTFEDAEAERRQRAEEGHRQQLADDVRAQAVGEIAEHVANEIAMDRRKERDQPLAIQRRMEGEVDPHDHDGEDVDRDGDDAEDARNDVAEAALDPVVDRRQHLVLPGRELLGERWESLGELVEARLPGGDERRERLDQPLRLDDDRRDENPGEHHQRAERSDDGGEEGRRRGHLGVPLEPLGDRPEIQGDQYPEKEEEKNLSDGLEQPEKQDCQDRRRQDRREFQAPYCFSRQLDLLLPVSSMSALTVSSSFLPAPI